MILKNTNPLFKITDWSFYHQLVISTFSSLMELASPELDGPEIISNL